MKRKEFIMVILASASWKSLWMSLCRSVAERALMGSITIDHIMNNATSFDEM